MDYRNFSNQLIIESNQNLFLIKIMSRALPTPMARAAPIAVSIDANYGDSYVYGIYRLIFLIRLAFCRLSVNMRVLFRKILK